MGAAGSLAKPQIYYPCAHCDPFGALRRENNPVLRDPIQRSRFVEFVKDGEWQEFLFGDSPSSLDGKIEGSLWKKYGYKHPCGVEVIRKESSKGSSKAWSECSEPTSSPSSSSVTTVPVEYITEDMSEIFVDLTDTKALIVGVLLPVFKIQCEGASDSSFLQKASYKKMLRENHCQRLQDILLRAAASVDAIALEEYMANQENCIADDLKNALDHLPVRVMISRVLSEEKSSPIFYDNGHSLSNQSGKVTIGDDLHVFCGLSCSPGTAQQLERAMFNGKTFKKCFWNSNYDYKLMAILPIFNFKNSPYRSKTDDAPVMFSVCVESSTFKGTDDFHVMEANFQIVEDLLGLLPLLLTHSHDDERTGNQQKK